MKTTSTSKLIDFLVYLFLVIFFIVSIGNYDFSGKNAFVTFTFLLNGGFSLFRIIKTDRNISLLRLYYIFVFVFLFYAPLSQYVNNINIWIDRGLNVDFSYDDYIYVNILIGLFNIVIELIYYFYKPRMKEHQINNESYISSTVYLAFIIINLLVLGYLYLTNNISSHNELDVSSGSLSIQLLNIIKFIPVSSMLILYMASKNNKSLLKYLSMFLVFIIVCVVYFPFYGSNSRFLLFGCYLCLISMIFSRFKYKSFYFLMFIIGFYFIFSSFNYFKYNNDFGDFSFSVANFSSEDFDAYQVFMTSIKYTNSNGYMFGNNFISSILCFVPREIWSGKSLPSGEIISSYYGSSFTNLSCTLIAECYISLGIFGVILGGIIFGMIFKFIDGFAFNNILGNGIFCILSGMEIYLIRGAILPTWSYTFALIISLFIMFFIYKKLCKIEFVSNNKIVNEEILWKR